MAVCCLQRCLKVTDILSYRDKHADRIVQLNCNRNAATPFLAVDYANKLLPTGLWHPSLSISLITLHSCGPREQDWQTYELVECLHVVWNIYGNETNMQTAVFCLVFALGRISPFVRFQTICFLVQIVRCQRICKHNSAASLLCQWAKGCTAGNDRTLG